MSTQQEQRKKWEDFGHEIIKRIDEIDNDTPWSETEPTWWLRMMEIRKLVAQGVQQ